MQIGIVGLGIMGSRAASKLLEAGHSVLGYDASEEARRRADAAGVRIVSGVQGFGETDVVFLSLPGPPEVEAVVTGAVRLVDHLPEGAVIVDLSSVDPGTSREMAAAAADAGLSYLDAPVLGRPPAVGNWILPVGGDEAALERVRDTVSCVAARAVFVGASGAGSAVKLLNNIMVGAMNAIISESMALSHKVGLSPRVLFDIIGSSKAPTNNLLFQVKGRKILEEDFAPSFRLDLLAKDNDLCVKMANQLGVPLLMGGSVDSVNKLAQLAGLGDSDTCVLYTYFKQLYGVS